MPRPANAPSSPVSDRSWWANSTPYHACQCCGYDPGVHPRTGRRRFPDDVPAAERTVLMQSPCAMLSVCRACLRSLAEVEAL